jgi:2-isopropylmalate synthase
VIEAGFPASSNGDFAAVSAIAKAIKNCTVCALARANEKDVRRAGDALKGAKSGRLHMFLASSPIHMKMKLRMTPEQVLAQAVKSIAWAREYTDNIEFSPEDAGRSEPDFLCRLVEASIAAGATTINIPDPCRGNLVSSSGICANVSRIRTRLYGRCIATMIWAWPWPTRSPR